MHYFRLTLAGLFIVLFTIIRPAYAQSIARYVIGNGGGTVTATNNNMLQSTIGQQTAIGIADAGTNGELRSGFWYVIRAGASGIIVNTSLVLAGPYIPGATSSPFMFTHLTNNFLLPLNQPYNVPPWNYAGTESVGSMPNGIVDWVLLSLRTTLNPSSTVATRAVLLHENGTVQDVNGSTDLAFNVSANQGYYIVVQHRNHVPARTSFAVCYGNMGTIPPGCSTECTDEYCFDWRQGATTTQMALNGADFGLWPGDANGDRQIQYAGDVSAIANHLGNPVNIGVGYHRADTNLDGQTRYLGPNRDTKVILKSLALDLAGLITSGILF